MTAPSGSFERLVLARTENLEVSAAGQFVFSADLKAVTGLEVYSLTVGAGSAGAITLPPSFLGELIGGLDSARHVLEGWQVVTPPAEAYADAVVDLANKAGDSIEDRRVNFERTTS